MREFNFNREVEETHWLIENLVPANHLCFNLAQAGVGKSLITEAMAISIIHGTPFCNLKVQEGDVLIIDQDTNEEAFTSRMLKLEGAMTTPRKYKLFAENMMGYDLNRKTLQTVIHDYHSVVLVVVDSLHSVLGGLNPNYTSDMSVLASMKKSCLNGTKTIIFNHHISQKEVLPIDALMMGDAGHLAMGSSAIMQQADSYFIIGAEASDGRLTRAYIRPVSKRVSIPGKPLIMRLVHSDKGEQFQFDGYYEQDIDNVEKDILALYQAQPDSERTVKETYEAMGHRHGEKAVRDALAHLDSKGLVVMSRHKSNLFKYRLL